MDLPLFSDPRNIVVNECFPFFFEVTVVTPNKIKKLFLNHILRHAQHNFNLRMSWQKQVFIKLWQLIILLLHAVTYCCLIHYLHRIYWDLLFSEKFLGLIEDTSSIFQISFLIFRLIFHIDFFASLKLFVFQINFFIVLTSLRFYLGSGQTLLQEHVVTTISIPKDELVLLPILPSVVPSFLWFLLSFLPSKLRFIIVKYLLLIDFLGVLT